MSKNRKNPCSLVVVNPVTGNTLHGTAAILHATSQAGGFDQYMENYGRRVLRVAYEEELREQRRKPVKLRVVK